MDKFQSTLPYAGSDSAVSILFPHFNISIHAPLCGERRFCRPDTLRPSLFQSTLPYAGSDLHGQRLRSLSGRFQSTLPYAGSDVYNAYRLLLHPDFNPRSPMRGATCFDRVLCRIDQFQSTLPYAGSDQRTQARGTVINISIHAPLCGERRSRWTP